MKNKDFPLIQVIWGDAVSGNGWELMQDTENEPHIITTVGYLIAVNKKSLLLAMTKDENSENVNCTFVIPKGMIYKIKRLKVV